MLKTEKYPKCNHCGRTFMPGEHWSGANYCRLAYLMPLIEFAPGITTRELAIKSRMAYADVSKALTKGRGLDLFGLVPEGRELGGFRYKYAVIAGWQDRLSRLLYDAPPITENKPFEA